MLFPVAKLRQVLRPPERVENNIQLNMKIYIKIAITLWLCFISASLSAQNSGNDSGALSEAMQTFKEACLTERKALSTKSQLTMGKAQKLFLKLKTAPFKYKVVAESQEGALSEPVMQFTSQYCEQLMRKSFSIVPLDTLHAMRADDVMHAQLLSENFSLEPNSSATISIRASGNCAMMVVSEDGLPVRISSSVDNTPLNFNSDENGTVCWQTWTLPKVKREMEFKLENPNDKAVSFTIAVQ